MAEGALSIKVRCASWHPRAASDKRDPSCGTTSLRAATPSGGLAQREIAAIAARLRQELAAPGGPTEPGDAAVTTSDQVRPGGPNDPGDDEP